MPLNLRIEESATAPGLTLFSDSLLGRWAKPTGVYLPPNVDLDTGVVNVLLYLHGWYVPSIEYLFKGDRAKVRQQVMASGKPVVLVAPYLGKGQREGSTFNVKDLGGRWGELYLDQVLGALAPMRDPETIQPPPNPYGLPASIMQGVPNPALRVGKLVIACHSGGGEGMRYLVGSLGRYRARLAECWGFDCLYGVNARPDDASFWYGWATGPDGRPLYISYGKSTVLQSVKLDLMGQGLAAADGSRRDPKGPQIANLKVKLGITTARPPAALMALDDIPKPPPPPARPKPDAKKFTEIAADNLSKNAGWPADLMEMHYAIARDGLAERLKAASFL